MSTPCLRRSSALAEVKDVLSSVLAGANIEALELGPLDNDADIAILATRRGSMFNKSPFGPGNAVAQVIVEDHGSTRHVELIALRDSFADGFNRQRAAGNAMAGLSAATRAPNIKSGRKMVDAILRELQRADPSIRPTK